MKITNEEITSWMREKQSCPFCGGVEFSSGPEAGISKNIWCIGCSARFNISMFDVELLSEPANMEGGIYAIMEVENKTWKQRFCDWCKDTAASCFGRETNT